MPRLTLALQGVGPMRTAHLDVDGDVDPNALEAAIAAAARELQTTRRMETRLGDDTRPRRKATREG